jgi:Rieske Fe-S protein
MTHSVVAGLILAKEVNGEKHPWSKLYSLNRFDNFKPDTSHINETENEDMNDTLNKKEFEKLGQDEAKVLNIDHKKIAAYEDQNGQIHAISAVCTHMGCTIEWNKKEKTWDCPCHGSRYNFDGQVIQGPALKDLEKFE